MFFNKIVLHQIYIELIN